MEAARITPGARLARAAALKPLSNGYLTVADVAELLGVAKSFVYRRTSKGHPDPIPCYRFGGHLRFLGHEVEAWATEHRKEADVSREGMPRLVAAASVEGRRRVRLRVREPRS